MFFLFFDSYAHDEALKRGQCVLTLNELFSVTCWLIASSLIPRKVSWIQEGVKTLPHSSVSLSLPASVGPNFKHSPPPPGPGGGVETKQVFSEFSRSCDSQQQQQQQQHRRKAHNALPGLHV